MMMTHQVPLWIMIRGVGHAVATVDLDSPIGTRTLCGMAGNMRGLAEVLPRKICRRCRDRLPHARPRADG